MSQAYSYPDSLKKLRACTTCHLVKTEEQFLKDGCDNCEEFNKAEALQNITPHFKGIIAITNPKYSWCAKWLHKKDLLPGFYSIDIIKDEEEEKDEYENEGDEEEVQQQDNEEENEIS